MHSNKTNHTETIPVPGFVAVIKSNSNSGGGRHYKQLDSLRAICILLVIVQHWIPGSRLESILLPGMIGVNFFFVISGFLITEILINNKKSVDKNLTTRAHAIKLFFARRSIRIFPIYYLTIFIMLAYNMGYVRNYTPYYLTYTVNFYNLIKQQWMPYGHLWSLCVEEQFYLVWPWVILFTPKKWLIHVIMISIVTGPASRLLISYFHNSFAFAFPLTSFDGFGLGALLAYSISILQKQGKIINKKLFQRIGLAGLCIMILNCAWQTFALPGNSTIGDFFYFPGIMMAGCYLVHKFTEGFKGTLKNIFESPLLLFIGKISYSLYIFHNILPDAMAYLGFSHLIPFEGYNKLIYLGILITLSTVSWYSFEKPILQLKRRFEYIK